MYNITAFINYYSKEAPEIVDGFKQKFMVNLLDNVYDTTKIDPVGVILNGNNLLKFLQQLKTQYHLLMKLLLLKLVELQLLVAELQ